MTSEKKQSSQQVRRKHLIGEEITEKLAVAYICVDQNMHVTRVSDNLAYYGYADIPIGSDINEYVDFMVGMNVDTDIELAFLVSPSAVPIAVSLMPHQDELVVVITDVSKQAEQRRMLQQKANENELLLNKQEKLLAQLESASQSLELKNKQLKEASRLQTLFLAGVSHEFRTPLTSIIGHADVMRGGLKKNNTADFVAYDDHLHAVQRSSKHLLSLVENLLDHGKFDSNEIVLHPKATQLSEVFDDVALFLTPLSGAKKIKFSVDTDFNDDTMVVVDASRLRQCLINLIGNAIKFTDVGSVKVSARFQNDTLKVEIIDTGIGIKKGNLVKATQPFWQAKGTGKSGTGLGLTITKKIIELMGGEFSLTSEYGKGTQVAFELMAPQISQQDLVGDLTDNKFQLFNGYKILLVEDDFDIAGLLLLMFAEAKINVSHVENGALAVEAMAEQRFDLVLMDLNMPVMGGHKAVKKIRESGDTTPIVIMSASALEADKKRAEKLACDGYLVKPVNINDILTVAEQITAESVDG